jgi:hypothetical protein
MAVSASLLSTVRANIALAALMRGTAGRVIGEMKEGGPRTIPKNALAKLIV